MKKCSHDCMPVCDFCIHFKKHYDEDGDFTGEGYCEVKKEDVEFSGYCEEFHCFNVKD